MKKAYKVITVLLILIILFASLWITGVLPSSIARVSAENYVHTKYSGEIFIFSEVYFDEGFNAYFVSFINKKGEVHGFRMSQYFPNTVMYDPLDPPG